MKHIQLTRGAFAIVDDEDYFWLNSIKWQCDNKGYARRAIYLGTIDGKPRYSGEAMHRLVMGKPVGLHIDHINGVRHDNRRCNLRVCTPGQNQMNIPKRRKSVSKYKGVVWCKRDKVWIAAVKKGGKALFRRPFKNELQAALAYDENARIIHGEFANVNFVDGKVSM